MLQLHKRPASDQLSEAKRCGGQNGCKAGHLCHQFRFDWDQSDPFAGHSFSHYCNLFGPTGVLLFNIDLPNVPCAEASKACMQN